MSFLDPSWKDDLIYADKIYKRASYNGVFFWVKSSEAQFGAKARAWGRWQGEPITEFVGIEPDRFQVEGYIIKSKVNYDANPEGYFIQRDLLIEALKRSYLKHVSWNKKIHRSKGFAGTLEGGLLIHPFYGEQQVLVEKPATFTESFEEGGICRFTINFIQCGMSEFPGQTEDFIQVVDISVLDMANAFLDGFLADFRAAGAFLSSMVDFVGNTLNRIANIANQISTAVQSVVSGIVSGINNIISGIGDILDAPCQIAQTFKDSADSLKQLYGDVTEVQFGGIVGGCSGETSGDTTTLDGSSIPNSLGISLIDTMIDQQDFTDSDLGSITGEQSNNVTLVVDMTKAMVLGVACQTAIRTEFNSINEAETYTNKIADALDDFLERLASDVENNNSDRFARIQELRASFIKAMFGKNSELAKEIDYIPPVDVQTCLSLAYDKYEDIDRSDEVFNRNKPIVRHPGFLPGGTEISILDE